MSCLCTSFLVTSSQVAKGFCKRRRKITSNQTRNHSSFCISGLRPHQNQGHVQLLTKDKSWGPCAQNAGPLSVPSHHHQSGFEFACGWRWPGICCPPSPKRWDYRPVITTPTLYSAGAQTRQAGHELNKPQPQTEVQVPLNTASKAFPCFKKH